MAVVRPEDSTPAADGDAELRRKARKIFDHFDADRDGLLSKPEMRALVVSVNPRVKFTPAQIQAILDKVFDTYSDFVDSDSGGLTFDGLVRTYVDGAGDIDLDFQALRLLNKVSFADDGNKDADLGRNNTAAAAASIIDERSESSAVRRRTQHMPSWAPSNISHDSTWLLVEDLLLLIKRLEAKMAKQLRQSSSSKAPPAGSASDASSDAPWSTDLSLNHGSLDPVPWEILGRDYTYVFRRELSEITQKAERASEQDEVFDAHMAIGWTLMDHSLREEAMASFTKACVIKPDDVRPHFHLGNVMYSLGDMAKARGHYASALNVVDNSRDQWLHILPQLHVNMGIALETEGFLLNACEQYKLAVSLTPNHYRALKLLGSALYGVGEYRSAEKVLAEAVAMKPDFADAHCDLASTLRAIGDDDERAINEFQKALDLKPDHVEALYNLAGLFKDMGRYQRAGEMYTKVLALQPNNWRAHLNKAVVLLGAGEEEESRKAFKEAFKMTNRVELYDAIQHLKLSKRIQKRNSSSSNSKAGSNGEEEVLVVDVSQFQTANPQTTPSQWLTSALVIRHFQLKTRLHKCDVSFVQKKFLTTHKPSPPASSSSADSPTQHLKSATKSEIEKLLRELLHSLGPATFQGVVKAINEKILCVLDPTGSGQVDLGIFLAVIAPICSGSLDRRKRVAFEALVWQSSSTTTTTTSDFKGAQVKRTEVLSYMKFLHKIFMSKDGMSETVVVHGAEEDESSIPFAEFVTIFDDHDWGFGVLDVLAKLEVRDRVRHDDQTCVVCAYPITGPWFKETTGNFKLCSLCYSEGKVPLSEKKDVYCFKEYNSKLDAIKDKLWLSRSKSASANASC